MEAKVLRMLVPMALEGLKVTLGVFAVTLICPSLWPLWLQSLECPRTE